MGNVQRTRHYVTGKALWGALTARLTRDYPELSREYSEAKQKYEHVGKLLNEQLAFSYFYPAVGAEVKPFPWDNADDFAWRYLNTYASTALDYGRNSAEDGSLHETEFIAPVTRSDKKVNLIGYIFERDDGSLPWRKVPWRKVLSCLQLGGERTYGWGRVRLESEPRDCGTTFWDGWQVELDKACPELRATGDNANLYAHTLTDGLDDARGRIEPLVGRTTTQAIAHGRELSGAQVCWMPGAKLTSANVTLQIGENGVWGKSA